MDIRFGITDLSYLGPDVLGAAFVRDREIFVSETLLNHEGWMRFTCGHELGHMLLHADTRQCFTRRRTFRHLMRHGWNGRQTASPRRS